jgi:hypothetical protein
MLWGISNLWKDGEEGTYAVRHGRRPVRDFGKTHRSREEAQRDAEFSSNFFEKAFPCLFPWGRGGIESIREHPVTFNLHIRWCLRQFDRRFRRHWTFPFLAFGITQRRQVLTSAKLQMKKQDFDHNARLMSSITSADLEKAQKEEELNKPFSNPGIKLMWKLVLAMSSRVQGTDAACLRDKPSIWTAIALDHD